MVLCSGQPPHGHMGLFHCALIKASYTVAAPNSSVQYTPCQCCHCTSMSIINQSNTEGRESKKHAQENSVYVFSFLAFPPCFCSSPDCVCLRLKLVRQGRGWRVDALAQQITVPCLLLGRLSLLLECHPHLLGQWPLAWPRLTCTRLQGQHRSSHIGLNSSLWLKVRPQLHKC